MSGGSKTTTTSNQQSSSQTQLPQWMTDAAQKTYSNASNAVAAHPTVAYSGQLTPGTSAGQQQASALASASVGTGQADLDAARGYTAMSTGAPMQVNAQAPTAATWDPTMSGQEQHVTAQTWSPDAVSRYMNPYVQQVQGNTLNTMRTQDAADHASLLDQIQGASAFGGTRGALMETEQQKNQALARQNYVDSSNAAGYNDAYSKFASDADRSLQADQGNASLYDQMLGRNQTASNEAASSNAASKNAMATGNADRDLQAQTTNSSNWNDMLSRMAAAGRTEGDIGTASSNMTGADISRLEATGGVDQQTQAAADQAKYNDWLRTQNGDVDQYKDLMAILAGAPRNVTTTGTSSGTQTVQQNPGLMGTLMGLGQLGVSAYSAGMFSDCRLKRDIRLIERIKGLGIYLFRYKWEPKGTRHVGVMAQEVEREMPWAVFECFGFKAVDYSKLGGLLA
jgi:hypothetical protein